jgi:ATP-dependent Clp protease ATP-binding subunit ClpX
MDLTELIEKDPENLREFLPNPVDIVKQLDEYVVGQDAAKKMLSLAALHRAVRSLASKNVIKMEYKLEKQNVLLMGPTGTGKTALIRALSTVLDVPITVFDISGVTSSGYIGESVTDIIRTHVVNCERETQDSKDNIVGDYAERLQHVIENGIIYIDEFDKIRKNNGTGRDVNGEAVQQELLKILEKGIINIPKHVSETVHRVNTENLLIICGGAFVDLHEIIAERLNITKTIGFTSTLTPTNKSTISLKDATVEDLIEYGFIPEILGRLSLRTNVEDLTLQEYLQILKLPKTSIIKQYQSFFKVFGTELKFNKKALIKIAKKAKDSNTGARSLGALVTKVLEVHQHNIFFNLGNKELIITEKDVEV